MFRSIRHWPSAARRGLLVAALLGAALPGQAQEGGSIEEMLAGQERGIAEARALVEADPANAQAWASLIQLTAMRAVLEANQRGEAPEVARAASRQASELLIAEWISRRPRDGGPHLARLYLDPQGAERDERLLALAERYPDDPAVLESAARLLASRGEHEAAGLLLGGYHERHPEDRQGYRLMLDNLASAGDTGGQRAVLRAWLDRYPSDAEALAAWLGLAHEPQFLDESRQRVAAALPELLERPAGHPEARLCNTLLRVADGAFRAEGSACLDHVTAAATDPHLRREVVMTRLREAGRDGDVAALEQALAGADAATAGAVAARYLGGLAWDDCRERSRIARQVWERWRLPGEQIESLAFALSACHEFLDAQQLFVEFTGRVESDRLATLLSSWNPRYPNQQRTHLPVALLAPALEARWRREGFDPEVGDALDTLYEAAGSPERRLDLFRRRAATPHPMTDARRMAGIADALLATGEARGAAELLDGVLAASPGDAKILARVIELRVMLGEPEAARAAAERALAVAESPWTVAEARLGLARLARLAGDPDAALQHYRAALAAGGGDPGAIGGEYLETLAGLGRPDEAVRVAIELCGRADFRRSKELSEACAGRVLSEAGLEDRAATFLAAGLAAAPASPNLLRANARAAEEGGDLVRAERLLRELVALDPEVEAPWAELGLLWMRAGDEGRHAAVLAETEREIGRPAILLRTQHAKLLLAAEKPREAARVLEEIKRLRPDLGYIDGLLREAYREAGKEAW